MGRSVVDIDRTLCLFTMISVAHGEYSVHCTTAVSSQHASTPLSCMSLPCLRERGVHSTRKEAGQNMRYDDSRGHMVTSHLHRAASNCS